MKAKMPLGKHNKKGNGAFALIVIIELLAQIMVTILQSSMDFKTGIESQLETALQDKLIKLDSFI